MRLPHPPLRGPLLNQGVIATGAQAKRGSALGVQSFYLIRCAGISPKGRVFGRKKQRAVALGQIEFFAHQCRTDVINTDGRPYIGNVGLRV